MKINREFKGTSLTNMVDDFTMIKVVTTGFSPTYDEILEIGALKVRNNKIIDQYQQLVLPVYEIDEFTEEITGISNDMLSDQPEFKDIANDLIEFIGDDILMAYNANHYVNFLYDNLHRSIGHNLRNDFVDVLRWSRRFIKDTANHKLCTISEKYKLGLKDYHRGVPNCHLVLIVKDKIIAEMNEIGLIDDVLFKKDRSNRKGFILSDFTAETDEFDVDCEVYGKKFVFTGKLEKMLRKEALQLVVNKGGLISDKLPKDTNYLVIGNLDYCTNMNGKKSSKIVKAEQLIKAGADCKIISEEDFYDFI